MKPIHFFFLFYFVAIASNAQDSLNDPLTDVRTMLVHNQLSPEIVKLENTVGLGVGSLKLSNKAINQFQQSILNFSAYPMTVINKPYKQLYMGLGYYNIRFDQFQTETASSFFTKKIESFFLSAAFNYRIKKNWFGFSYAQAGLNGTDPFQTASQSFNMVFLNKIMHKVSRNKTVGLGFAYFTNMGYPLALPAVTYTISKKNYLINVDFPLKTEVEGILFNGKLRPVIGSSFHGGTYYLKDRQQILYNYGALGYLGMRFKVADLLYLYSAYQVGIMDVYKTPVSGTLQDVGTLAGQSQWVISINVQFAKFIPLHQK